MGKIHKKILSYFNQIESINPKMQIILSLILYKYPKLGFWIYSIKNYAKHSPASQFFFLQYSFKCLNT